MQLLAATEVRWFEADGAQQQIDPFVGGELIAARAIFFEVECRKLDRSQAVDPEWAALALLLFVVLMSNIHLRPNPAHQQAVVIPQEMFGDVDVLVTEVLQFGPVLVVVGNVSYLNLVDEGVLPLILDHRLRFVGLIGTDEV
jgi:hypothetical protein